MLVNLYIFGVSLPRQSVPDFLHFLAPPGDLLSSYFVFHGCFFELSNCSLLQLLLLEINQFAHLVELFGDFLQNVTAL